MGRKRKPHYARKTLSVLMVTAAFAFVTYSSVHLFAIDTTTAGYATTGITAASSTAGTASSTISNNTATSVSGTTAITTTNSGTSASTADSTLSTTQICPKTRCAAVSCHGKTPAKVYYSTHP